MKKKSTERFFVKWFIHKIGWDSCRVIDDEEPDFRLEFPDKIIGLEVTNLYKDEKRKGSHIKRDESFRNTWLKEASKKYYENSDLPIRLQVLIKSGELKCDPSLLADKLAQMKNTGVWERIEFEFELSGNCILKISFVRLPDEFAGYNRWTFIDNHVGFSRTIDEIQIRNKIKNKSIKLPKYKEKYDEVALLIVTDRTYESGMFHAVTNGFVIPNSGFSSVYLALYPENYLKIG